MFFIKKIMKSQAVPFVQSGLPSLTNHEKKFKTDGIPTSFEVLNGRI